MVVADLHVHTTASDGTLPLAAVPTAAERAGLDVVAITDHDRPHPDLSDAVTTLDGITVVHGIELRVETNHQRLDLLGFGLERTPDLLALVDHLQTDRAERARAIVDCIEDRTGVDLDLSIDPGVGRPHIARAVAASDADFGYQAAFDSLIGADCPCYIHRNIPSFAEGVDVLRNACPVVGLAHPLRYDQPENALDYCRKLDAIERYYPYERDPDTSVLDEAIAEYDLLPTGGSDAHGEQLGRAGLDAGGAMQILSRLGTE